MDCHKLRAFSKDKEEHKPEEIGFHLTMEGKTGKVFHLGDAFARRCVEVMSCID